MGRKLSGLPGSLVHERWSNHVCLVLLSVAGVLVVLAGLKGNFVQKAAGNNLSRQKQLLVDRHSHGRAGPRDAVVNKIRIDYLVRTTAGDLPYLLPMLASAEKFLDSTRYNHSFYVVLDEEKADDHKAALLLPKWVNVRYEKAPNFSIPSPMGFGMHMNETVAGWTRSQWSCLRADNYGDAPFIAILDTDVVFKAYCGESLTFFDPSGKPRIFCSQHRDLGMSLLRDIDPAMAHLNPWSCMESLPFIFRRSDLPLFRSWLTKRMNATGFDAAFDKLLHMKQYYALAIAQTTMLGAWAFTYAYHTYAWAVGGGGNHSTCPVLRVGHHVPYARQNWIGAKLPKLHKTYFREASQAVFEGDCWAKAACGQPMPQGCSEVVRNGSQHHALLSLEGDYEMMFGGGSRPLAKPDCAAQVDELFQSYRKCLAQRCPAATT